MLYMDFYRRIRVNRNIIAVTKRKLSDIAWIYHYVFAICLCAFHVAVMLWVPLGYAVEHGPIITLDTPLVFGPGTEPYTDSSPETKFLMLHFTDSTLDGEDRVEINLGYDTDVFTSASGPEFWTRPIGGNTVTINYIDDGDGTGSVSLDRYGRGEQIDIFLTSDAGLFTEPQFTEDGICDGFPDWLNVACLDEADPEQNKMKDVARSTGMIIWESHGDCDRWPEHGIDYDSPCLHSCSAALVDEDLILTAAHCVQPNEYTSGSFTLDFQTNCDGTYPEGYSPKFYKIKRMVIRGDERSPSDTRDSVDYSIIQIDTGTEGIGVPPLPIRLDTTPVPVDEEIFLIHHPKGTAKKVSRYPIDPSCIVNDSSSTRVYHGCDVDHGSSGSSVFDLMGQALGVASGGMPCSISHQNSQSIQEDILTEPPPERDVNVMTVFDRSGSMRLPGLEGSQKIEEARQATALFNDLLSIDASNRAGLVSFSTVSSDPVDFELQPVTSENKEILIGPAPYRNEGIVASLTPGGSTTIGGGLEAAQEQFPTTGPGHHNTPAILLMTDGLQNTPPMIEEVDLDTTRLCSVGFGTEASIDGPLLTSISRDHGGNYTRAGDGLELKKFFVLCFGNIFHTGISLDPAYTMPAGATTVRPIPLNVCGEETLTVVLGWEHSSAWLKLSLLTPGGDTITPETQGVVASAGATWSYLRLPLPFNGERDGTWKVQVTRPPDPEFGPSNADERFFVTSVVDGGPYFRPLKSRRYYTGDDINPLVFLRRPNGARVPAKVIVNIDRPTEGTGNILTKNGLGKKLVIGGDSLDARSSTLISLEQENGGTLVPKVTHTFPLFDDAMHQDGALESDGVFGNPLQDITRYEGNYTFHARAHFGKTCSTSREATWTTYVSVSIDPDNTEVDTQITDELPDGRKLVKVLFTPRDRYGNYMGPGRSGSFEVTSTDSSTPSGGVVDNGDGSYTQEVEWNPGSGKPPGLSVIQPGRPPVLVEQDVPGEPKLGLLQSYEDLLRRQSQLLHDFGNLIDEAMDGDILSKQIFLLLQSHEDLLRRQAVLLKQFGDMVDSFRKEDVCTKKAAPIKSQRQRLKIRTKSDDVIKSIDTIREGQEARISK